LQAERHPQKNVGKRLEQAQDAYQDAFGQLSRGRGNMLSQVESLKALGAKTSKTLPVEFEDVDGEVAQIEARMESDD
jgi:DNA recombination protein RmuC